MTSHGRWTGQLTGTAARAGPPADPATPARFAHAVAQLRALRPRREIELTELAAPRGVAPFSYAVGAVIHGDPRLTLDQEMANGRFILLHDPSEPEPWDGDLRLVAYVTAELEPDLATDPLLPQVGWSWLTDALAAHSAAYTALAGTVTQTTSTRFGDLAGPPPAADVEIRASWTPLGEPADGRDGDPALHPAGEPVRGPVNVEAHALAWCALLASTAGLPPPGVSALPSYRPRVPG